MISSQSGHFPKFPMAEDGAAIHDWAVLDEFQESLGAAPSMHLPYPTRRHFYSA